MNFSDVSNLFLLALCLWREARGEGRDGMVAVAAVIRNRTARDKSSVYAEVIRKWQFSSMTAANDPELGLFPVTLDVAWQQAGQIAQSALSGTMGDPTGGATLYYSTTMDFPKTWNASKCQFTVQIGKHRFYREVA